MYYAQCEMSLNGGYMGAITQFLQNSASLALNSGIEKEKICLDGGIGFAKNREQNIELLNGYDRLYTLGISLTFGRKPQIFVRRFARKQT